MNNLLEIKDDSIQINKNCKYCIFIKTCKFHSMMSEYSKSFYAMNKYAEHNNVLQVFENHASCDHFENSIKNINDLPEEILQILAKKHMPDWATNFQIINSVVKYRGLLENTKIDEEINLADILKNYTLIP